MTKITLQELKQEMEKAQSRLQLDQLEKRYRHRLQTLIHDCEKVIRLGSSSLLGAEVNECIKPLTTSSYEAVRISWIVWSISKPSEQLLKQINTYIRDIEEIRMGICSAAYEKGFYITPSDEILPLHHK
jgi:hypothetical protein